MGKRGVIVELKDYHQYVVKIDGSSRLTVRNRKFLKKNNPPGNKSRGSVPCLRETNMPLQRLVVSGGDEVKDPKENFDVVRFQKGICFKAGGNIGKICSAKPDIFLSLSDCMDGS